MKLRELFTLISNIGNDKGISKIFLCGGAVRDRILGTLDKLEDIDLTTGDKTIKNLAKEISSELSQKFTVDVKEMDDGHTSVYLQNIKLDFSSNFEDPLVTNYLSGLGIKNPTPLQKEMFSRDFTCNALLMSLDLSKAIDPTKKGINDIKAKVLRTCMPPEITLKSNVNRIIRAIYLAAKLDFTLDPEIVKYISSNKELISQIDNGYLSKTLNKALKYNPEKTAALLDQLDLWKSIPVTEVLYPYYAKRFIKQAQLRKNFDYGEGFYANMPEYKSVMEFRKKRKKKQKKDIKKIKDMKLK